MIENTPAYKTVADVFMDFKGRRAGVIKALTVDFAEFHAKCDPEKECLCLFGYPNETWKVTEPQREVPTEFPEPVLGINYGRDELSKQDWIAFIALHSDVWLLSHTFSIGASLKFGKGDRNELFDMINSLPTIFELVGDSAKKQSTKKPKASTNSSKKSKSDYKSKETDDICGFCGQYYVSNEFWICCDTCERWFHGKCVDITPERAFHMKQYTCPICSHKRKSI